VRSVLTQHPVLVFDIGLLVIGQRASVVLLPALRSAKWIVSVSRWPFPNTIVLQMIQRWGAIQRSSRLGMAIRQRMRKVGLGLELIQRWSATRRSSRLVMTMRQRMRKVGQILRSLYKNRSRISVLSDYTWYVSTSSSSPGEKIVDDEKNSEKGSAMKLS
jgi:hypothetical protein